MMYVVHQARAVHELEGDLPEPFRTNFEHRVFFHAALAAGRLACSLFAKGSGGTLS